MDHASRSEVLFEPREVRSGSMAYRRVQEPAEVRVFSVWGRSEAMYWSVVRDDGGGASARYDCIKVSGASSRRTDDNASAEFYFAAQGRYSSEIEESVWKTLF